MDFLPTDLEAERLLRRLGVDADDVRDVLAARPAGSEPALVRLYESTLALLGVPVPVEGHKGWPAQQDTPVGRHLPVRGVMYTLGRLDFHLGELSLSNGPCGSTLGVHVPGGSPLSPAECDASLERAASFFGRHFPDRPIALLHCDSWLLDPQLADYLPSESNIVRFQRRFELLPEVERRVYDGRVLEHVFGRAVSPGSYETLPRATTLQRAISTHLAAGRHWYVRTGWLRSA